MINSVGSSGYIQNAVSFTKQNPSTQQTEAIQQTGDSITLSDSACLLSSLCTQLGGTSTSISLDDLEANLEQTLAKVKQETTALFLENGISLDPPVELTTDSEGSVRVVGDHPDKEKIEQLFEDNPELANDIRKADGLSSLIEAGKEHLAFSKEYENNAYAAVAKYGHLFDGMPDEESWSIVIGEEAA